MKVLIVNQMETHSDFAFLDTFHHAGMSDIDIRTIRPVELERNSADQSPDLIVIEGLNNLEITKNMVTQSQKQCPDAKIFVLYHSEAEPHSLEERAKLQEGFTNMGVDGFADASTDTLAAPARLLAALDIQPNFKILKPIKAVILLGDFHFDVIARKAYYIGENKASDDNHSDNWKPLGRELQRLVFHASARGRLGDQYFGPASREGRVSEIYQQYPSFDLTEEEAKLIDTLRDDFGQYYKPQPILFSMYDAETTVILPEASSIVAHRDSITAKISQLDPTDAQRYILFSDELGLRLNEPSLEIDPELSSADKEAAREAERLKIEAEATAMLYPDFQLEQPAEDLPAEDLPGETAEYRTYLVPDIKTMIGESVFANLQKGTLQVAGQKQSVEITDAEALLIAYLFEHPEQAVGVETLNENIYSGSSRPETEEVYALADQLNLKFREQTGYHSLIHIDDEGLFALASNDDLKPRPGSDR